MLVAKKFLTCCFLVVLASFFVLASNLEYPYYMDVNGTEDITYVNNEISDNVSVYIEFDGQIHLMNHTNTSGFWYVSVTNTEEDDVPFIVSYFNETGYNRTNFSHNTMDDYISISDDYFYVGIANRTKNTSDTGYYEHLVCAWLSANTNVDFRFVVGTRKSNETGIVWNFSDPQSTLDNDWDVFCGKVPLFQDPGNYSLVEYVGVQCLNCDGKTLRLGVDSNLSGYNVSAYFTNSSLDSLTRYTSGNFMISFYEFTNLYEEELRGVMRWRVPFYVTVRFWKADIENKSSAWTSTEVSAYKNDFQYVYMQFANSSASLNPLKDVSYLDSWFGWVPFYKPVFSEDLDTTLSFWAPYSDGSALVKLYEAGNYTLGIITFGLKGFSWDYEFVYPQFNNEKYKSKIIKDLDPVSISEETNSTLDVYISMWEINKYNVIMNLVYNIVIIVVAVVIFVVCANFGGAKIGILGATAFITVMKLLGLVIL